MAAFTSLSTYTLSHSPGIYDYSLQPCQIQCGQWFPQISQYASCWDDLHLEDLRLILTLILAKFSQVRAKYGIRICPRVLNDKCFAAYPTYCNIHH